MADERLVAMWADICRRLKQGEMNLPLWRALDAAQPVALDGTTFVVGFDVARQHEAGTLAQPLNEQRIRTVLATIATRPLTLLVIDGTTPSDYEHWKTRQQAAQVLREQPKPSISSGPIPEGVTTIHHDAGGANRYMIDLHRRLHAKFVETPYHNQTLTKVEFMLAVLPEFVEAERVINECEPGPEQRLRHISRGLDKLAEYLEMPASTVALAFLRYKRGELR